MKRQELENLALDLREQYGFSDKIAKSLAIRMNKEGRTTLSEDVKKKIAVLTEAYGPERMKGLSQQPSRYPGGFSMPDLFALPLEDLEKKAALWQRLYSTLPCRWTTLWTLPYEELEAKMLWWTDTFGTERFDWPVCFEGLPLEEMKPRYEAAAAAVEKECLSGMSLTVPAEDTRGYLELFDRIGLTGEDRSRVMQIVLKCRGGLYWLRPAASASYLIDGLSCFGISEAERRAFVCETAYELFQYSEEAEREGRDLIDWVYKRLCEKYGPEEGYRKLRECPWAMRGENWNIHL